MTSHKHGSVSRSNRIDPAHRNAGTCGRDRIGSRHVYGTVRCSYRIWSTSYIYCTVRGCNGIGSTSYINRRACSSNGAGVPRDINYPIRRGNSRGISCNV